MYAYVCICMHMYAYVCICMHMYLRISKNKPGKNPWRASCSSASASRMAVPAELPAASKLCFSSTAKFRACRWVVWTRRGRTKNNGEEKKKRFPGLFTKQVLYDVSCGVFKFGIALHGWSSPRKSRRFWWGKHACEKICWMLMSSHNLQTTRLGDAIVWSIQIIAMAELEQSAVQLVVLTMR